MNRVFGILLAACVAVTAGACAHRLVSSPEGTTTTYVQNSGVLVYAPRAARAQKVVFDTEDDQLIHEPDTPFREFFDSRSADFASGQTDYAKTTILGDVIAMLRNKQFIRLMLRECIERHMDTAIRPPAPRTHLRDAFAAIPLLEAGIQEIDASVAKLDAALEESDEGPQNRKRTRNRARRIILNAERALRSDLTILEDSESSEVAMLAKRSRSQLDRLCWYARLDILGDGDRTVAATAPTLAVLRELLATLRSRAETDKSTVAQRVRNARLLEDTLHLLLAEESYPEIRDEGIDEILSRLSGEGRREREVSESDRERRWRSVWEATVIFEDLTVRSTGPVSMFLRDLADTLKERRYFEAIIEAATEKRLNLFRSSGSLRGSVEAALKVLEPFLVRNLGDELARYVVEGRRSTWDAFLHHANQAGNGGPGLLRSPADSLSGMSASELTVFGAGLRTELTSSLSKSKDLAGAMRAALLSRRDVLAPDPRPSPVPDPVDSWRQQLEQDPMLRDAHARLESAAKKLRAATEAESSAKAALETASMELLEEIKKRSSTVATAVTASDRLKALEDDVRLIERKLSAESPPTGSVVGLVRALEADRADEVANRTRSLSQALGEFEPADLLGAARALVDADAAKLDEVAKQARSLRDAELVLESVQMRLDREWKSTDGDGSLRKDLVEIAKAPPTDEGESPETDEVAEDDDGSGSGVEEASPDGESDDGKDEMRRALRALIDEIDTLVDSVRPAMEEPASTLGREALKEVFESIYSKAIAREARRDAVPEPARLRVAMTEYGNLEGARSPPAADSFLAILKQALDRENIRRPVELRGDVDAIFVRVRAQTLAVTARYREGATPIATSESGQFPALRSILGEAFANVDIPPDASRAREAMALLFERIFRDHIGLLSSNDPILVALLKDSSVRFSSEAARSAGVGGIPGRLTTEAGETTNAEGVAKALRRVIENPDVSHLFGYGSVNRAVVQAFRSEFHNAFKHRLTEALAAETEADYDYWWLTFYPKAIPLQDHALAGESVVEVGFPESVIPDEQYHRWLQDQKNLEHPVWTDRERFSSRRREETSDVIKVRIATSVLSDFLAVLDSAGLGDQYSGVRESILAAMSDFTRSEDAKKCYRDGVESLLAVAVEEVATPFAEAVKLDAEDLNGFLQQWEGDTLHGFSVTGAREIPRLGDTWERCGCLDPAPSNSRAMAGEVRSICELARQVAEAVYEHIERVESVSGGAEDRDESTRDLEERLDPTRDLDGKLRRGLESFLSPGGADDGEATAEESSGGETGIRGPAVVAAARERLRDLVRRRLEDDEVQESLKSLGRDSDFPSILGWDSDSDGSGLDLQAVPDESRALVKSWVVAEGAHIAKKLILFDLYRVYDTSARIAAGPDLVELFLLEVEQSIDSGSGACSRGPQDPLLKTALGIERFGVLHVLYATYAAAEHGISLPFKIDLLCHAFFDGSRRFSGNLSEKEKWVRLYRYALEDSSLQRWASGSVANSTGEAWVGSMPDEPVTEDRAGDQSGGEGDPEGRSRRASDGDPSVDTVGAETKATAGSEDQTVECDEAAASRAVAGFLDDPDYRNYSRLKGIDPEGLLRSLRSVGRLSAGSVREAVDESIANSGARGAESKLVRAFDSRSTKFLRFGCLWPFERDLDRVREDLRVVLTHQFYSQYPGVPSAESIRREFVRVDTRFRALVYMWLRELWYRLETEAFFADAKTRKHGGLVTECRGDASCDRCKRIRVVANVFLDRYPFLTPDAREHVIDLVLTGSSMDQWVENVFCHQRLVDQLDAHLLEALFRPLWGALGELSKIERTSVPYDHVGRVDYERFLHWGKPAVQKGIQIVDVLPASRDDLVSISVNEGGLVAQLAAQAEGSATYDLNKLEMAARAAQVATQSFLRDQSGDRAGGAETIDELTGSLSRSQSGSRVNNFGDVSELIDSTRAGGYSLGAAAEGSIYARARAAMAYARRREYLDAAITASGRGDSFAKWVVRKSDFRSDLADTDASKLVAAAHNGYPNGDQPFHMLVKVPNSSSSVDWDGNRYVLFNSSYAATKRVSFWKTLGFLGVVIRVVPAVFNPNWWSRTEEAMVGTVFPFKWNVKSQRAQKDLLREPSRLGGRIYLDDTDKVKFSEVRALLDAEQAFVRETRAVQNQGLAELLKTINSEAAGFRDGVRSSIRQDAEAIRELRDSAATSTQIEERQAALENEIEKLRSEMESLGDDAGEGGAETE